MPPCAVCLLSPVHESSRRLTEAAGSIVRSTPAYYAPVLWSQRPAVEHLALRPFHTSPPALAEPSSSRASSTSAAASKDDETAVTKPKDPLGTRIWAKVKHEALHYWHGTKLLGKEIRLSAKYQVKLLRGKKLTRRERRQVRLLGPARSPQSMAHSMRTQLKRTTTDLLRLIPFSVFVIVPFMELLLPVALRLFPNMLPSTFREDSKELEKKRKLLKVRLEMAKFLQETIRESGLKSPQKIKESEEFKEFFRKVRSTGESPSTDDIVRVARLFEGDLTLDNLSRPQLVSMCRSVSMFCLAPRRSRMLAKVHEHQRIRDGQLSSPHDPKPDGGPGAGRRADRQRGHRLAHRFGAPPRLPKQRHPQHGP